MGKRVCLDAGHYGKYNKCPNNKKYYESEVMWKLHLLEKKYLEMYGIEVATTRTNLNTDLGVVERGKLSKGFDLLISDHSNAVGSFMNENVDHVAIYVLTDDVKTEVDDISKLFAKKIAPVIANIMDTKQDYKINTRKCSYDRNNDGVLNDNYYGLLHGGRLVNTPSVIIEHSFHTNTRTVNWLLDDNNLEKLAKAKAECIAEFLLGKAVVKDEKTDTLYKVQIGAFENKENAERLSKELEAKGYKTYITTNN